LKSERAALGARRSTARDDRMAEHMIIVNAACHWRWRCIRDA
jgi:hypothetical protein